jgi:hypothetical protein
VPIVATIWRSDGFALQLPAQEAFFVFATWIGAHALARLGRAVLQEFGKTDIQSAFLESIN